MWKVLRVAHVFANTTWLSTIDQKKNKILNGYTSLFDDYVLNQWRAELGCDAF